MTSVARIRELLSCHGWTPGLHLGLYAFAIFDGSSELACSCDGGDMKTARPQVFC